MRIDSNVLGDDSRLTIDDVSEVEIHINIGEVTVVCNGYEKLLVNGGEIVIKDNRK